MTTVYIPTRQRPQLLSRAIATWKPYGYPIVVVTDNSREVPRSDVMTISPSKKKAGVGYARQLMLADAKKRKESVIIMADDDHIPRGDIEGMVEFASRSDVLGVGAWKNIFGSFMRGTVLGQVGARGEDRAFLTTGSMGYNVWALNVKNAVAAGGFDGRLRFAEDAELVRQGIVKLGLPWYIFTGARAQEMMSSKRLRAERIGGVATLESTREKVVNQAHAIIHQTWPDYVSPPGKPYRCAWKRMYTDHVKVDGWPLENIETKQEWDWKGEG